MSIHGGDVWQIGEELGLRAEDLLDFSANVNPRGLPERALARLANDGANAKLLALYPDPDARYLRRALSDHLQVPTDSIVVGPGAEALLALILRSTGATSTLVPIPAFSEYRRICAQLQIDFRPWSLNYADDFQLPTEQLCEHLVETRPGALILNNPHNPSGGLIDSLDVHRIVDAAETAGVPVVLDEAFIDYAPSHSLAKVAARNARLIVVRSLTKFYGCPALRVGYAISHPDTISAIRCALPTWSVSQLAMNALSEALRDDSYASETLSENRIRRGKLTTDLAALKLKVLPSAANYILIELASSMPRSAGLRIRLAEHHNILIRNCDSYEGLECGRWIRVAVRTEFENQRLVEALRKELTAP